MSYRVTGCSSNVPITIEIGDKATTDTPTDVYRKDAETLVRVFRTHLPSDTYSRLMRGMLMEMAKEAYTAREHLETIAKMIELVPDYS